MPGTVVETAYSLGNVRRISLTCTADSVGATYPSTALTTKFEGRLIKLVTNPGTTQPTDDYDVVLNDQHGHDVLEGVGINRDTLNTEEVPIVYSGSTIHPWVDESDALTLVISGNAVNSAVTVIDLYYALGG